MCAFTKNNWLIMHDATFQYDLLEIDTRLKNTDDRASIYNLPDYAVVVQLLKHCTRQNLPKYRVALDLNLSVIIIIII